jgi:Pyridoxal-phosphate dependent enzyme
MTDYTPVQMLPGGIWAKRDDLYERAGVNGGKVRTCWTLAQGAPGLVTAGARQSPQAVIVSRVARELGIPCRVHMPSGAETPESKAATEAGAEVVRHTPGYNSVIIARAHEDAALRGWREIPFGMECPEAVAGTAEQVGNLPWGGFGRIVVPIGSGMSLAGILSGLKVAREEGRRIHDLDVGAAAVRGIMVGADPRRRLDKWAPNWKFAVAIEEAEGDYHTPAAVTEYAGMDLDPYYEAKCIPFLRRGDLLWVVGRRPYPAEHPEDDDADDGL